MKLSKEHFMHCMATLAEVYSKDVGENFFLIYWECLKNKLTDDDLSFAVKLHMTHSDRAVSSFFPKPADLLRYQADDYKLQALTAWEAITCGNQALAKQDPVANNAMRMIGGWDNFAMAKIDDLPYRSRDFIEAYVLLCEKNEQEETMNDSASLKNILGKVLELKNKAQG